MNPRPAPRTAPISAHMIKAMRFLLIILPSRLWAYLYDTRASRRSALVAAVTRSGIVKPSTITEDALLAAHSRNSEPDEFAGCLAIESQARVVADNQPDNEVVMTTAVSCP